MPWIDGEWVKDRREIRVLIAARTLAWEALVRGEEMSIVQSLQEAERIIAQEERTES